MLRKEIVGLAGWLALAFAVAAVGAVASVQAVSFYAQLVRPTWAPPASLFGPVWSVLYALMGIAAWLVWRERGAKARAVALALFVIQLTVNALWSWLFFAWRLGALAFADVVVLVVLVALTLGAFWRVRPLAGAMLIPYLCWLVFAAALTWSVWQANPTLLK
jgi:translocator protein